MSKRKFTLIAAVLLCMLYSCQSTTQAADKAPFDTPAVDTETKIKIVGPNEVLPGDLVVLHVDGSDNMKPEQLSWSIIPAEASARFLSVNGGKDAVFASRTPGTYYFVLATAQGDVAGNVTHKLINGKGGPSPDPEPEPEPDPTPVPGKKFVMVISESGPSGDVIENLRRNMVIAGVNDYVVSKEHEHRFLDPDHKDTKGNVPDWFKTYLEEVKKSKVEFPALIVGDMNSEGTVENIIVKPLPKTALEAIEIIQKRGG